MVKLLLAVAAVVKADECSTVSTFDKVDCKFGNEGDCNNAGCCWQPVDPNPDNTPWCFYKAGDVKTCSLKSAPKEPFTSDEVKEIHSLFEANLDIQGSGMVVAAPDHNTGPGGDYYYAWMRDGALSMNALLQTSDLDAVETKMDHWVDWVERSYKQDDPTGGDIMTEPKFNIPDGTPFSGGWCRPQNDGPGLRAITLMAYADKKPDVASRAWELVKMQLDWVVTGYKSNGCDLWEEVQSNDFFWNRYTMRKALQLGSDFANKVGKDSDRAAKYAQTAKEISDALSDHIEDDGFVFESTNRKIDTAVIEAFNVGDMEDGLFGPLSREAIMTLVGLAKNFCNEYDLNQQAAKGDIPGVLFGRYKGDSYDGGNPWVLLTASAATLMYRQAAAMAAGGKIEDATASSALEALLGQDVTAENLLGGGDAILNRMRTFLSNGLHMNEQIDRNSGSLTSAKDLTWNYANVLKAMKARSAAAVQLPSTVIV
jgi:glucoamylase